MSEKALAAAIWPNLYGSSTMGVKKSTVCKSRPPPNGTYPASSRVSIPLTKPSTAVGASPLIACSRSPGANFDAQPALVEYFVSLMRARSSIADKSIPARTSGGIRGEALRDSLGRRVPCPVGQRIAAYHQAGKYGAGQRRSAREAHSPDGGFFYTLEREPRTRSRSPVPYYGKPMLTC